MNYKLFLQKKLFVILCILLHLSIGVSLAQATQEPSVEVQLGSKTEYFQGEKVGFYIKLLSPSVFAGSPRFELPSLTTGLLYQVQARPVLGTENRDGQSYTSQLYEIWFFPKQSGEITVPEITVTFSTSSTGTSGEKQYTQKTSPFNINVKPIPGVSADEYLIVTDDLEVTQTWKPEVKEGEVGDAVTRTISMRAKNMAAIFLPEIETPDIKGVSIYRDAPLVNDRNQRGEATADRRDVITYVFEAEGEYTIPNITITWWDSASNKVRENVLKGSLVTISVNPLGAEGAGNIDGVVKGSVNLRLIFLFVASFFCVAIITFKKYGQVREYFRSRSEIRAQSEKAYFLRFKKACDSDDSVAAYNTLCLWFAKKYGNNDLISNVYCDEVDPTFQLEFEKLNTYLFTENKTVTKHNWKGNRLYRIVKNIRKNRASTNNKKMKDVHSRQINF